MSTKIDPLVHFVSCTPIDNTLVCDCGIGTGGCHFRVVREARWGIWADPMSTARVALGAKKVTAWGRMVSKCSTARKVTTSARGQSGRTARTSARSVITLTLVNLSARAASRRKAAFLWLDSIIVKWMLRRPHFQGKGGESGAGADVEDTRSTVLSTQYLVPS